MHKLALADKFQAIKYMNQCPDFEIWVEAGSGSSSYEKTKSPYSMSFREQRCVSKGNAVWLWMGIGMEHYFYIGKGTMEVLCTKNPTNDLGGSAGNPLSCLYTQARLLLQILFSLT